MNTPSNWLRNRSFGLCAAVALVAVLPMADGQTYGVTQLPTLGGSITTPLAISNTGIIAGNSNLTGDTETHAFKYVNGTIADLGVLSGTDSYAGGVNNGGEVVGNSGTISTFDAFSYANGKLTDLGTLGGTQSWALGVNSVGTVVGVSYLSGNSVNHGFSYSGGVMTDLGTLGGPTSNAYAINDSGVIVGNADYSATNHHAFSSSAGVMTDLGTLGGVKSTALGINNLGYIVGDAQTAGGLIDAFSYFGGKMTDLGGLPGATLSYAYGINNSLTIVGYSTGGSFVHAFVYSNGQMTDLNSLVSLSAVTLTKASGVNDIGQIIATGSDNQAYLLTPLAIHAAVTAAPSVDAGYSMSVTVSVLDGSNLPVTGYSGIIQLSSSDGAALLPAGTTLANGSGTFTVTLKMDPDSVAAYLRAAKAESSSPLGFHGHDNLSLAMANTLRAIEEGAVLVDSSLQGMGRSAGNTVTEVLVAILQRRGFLSHIDLKAAMDVGQGLIQPLLGKRGIDPMAVTSGLAKFHSSFTDKVQRYARKHQIDVRDLIVRLCQEDQVSAPDELLDRLSHELASLKMPRVLSIPAFRVEWGQDKTPIATLELLLKELKARAVKAGKFSTLNLVIAGTPHEGFVVSGNIHSTSLMSLDRSS